MSDLENQAADIAQKMKVAAALVKSISAPASAHAIWIKTDVEDGQFVNRICMSIRPGFESAVSVPAEYGGEQVCALPWPEAE